MLERSHVGIPGEKTFELPPLLVSGAKPVGTEQIMNMASNVIDRDDLVPDLALDNLATSADVEGRKMGMAIKLVDAYLAVERQWRLGGDIAKWVRHCEYTFERVGELRPLLRPDVWPHASRSNFVTLLEDKAFNAGDINIQAAVGLRLAFHRLPPLWCCGDQFLFYLNGTIATAAYNTWAGLQPPPVNALPPDRFHFEVVVL